MIWRVIFMLGLWAGAAAFDLDQIRLRTAPGGGGGGGGPVSQVTWTLQSEPTPRPGFVGYFEFNIFNPLSSKVMVYTTISTSGSIYSSDLFEYNAATNTWEKHTGGNGTLSTSCPSSTGSWPGDRHAEQMAVDTTRNRIWMFSGVCSGTNRDDTWYYSMNANLSSGTWTQISPSTLPDCCGNSGSMIYSPDDDVVVLMGPTSGGVLHVYVLCPSGSSKTSEQAAAGCSSTNEWYAVSYSGTPPTGTNYGGAIYDPVRHVVLHFAGNTSGGAYVNGLNSYNIATKTWSARCQGGCTLPPVFTGGVTGVNRPPWAFDADDDVFIYRQTTNTGSPKDWAYDPDTDLWTALTTIGSGPTIEHYQAYDPVNHKIIGWSRNAGDGEPDVWHAVVH